MNQTRSLPEFTWYPKLPDYTLLSETHNKTKPNLQQEEHNQYPLEYLKFVFTT